MSILNRLSVDSLSNSCTHRWAEHRCAPGSPAPAGVSRECAGLSTRNLYTKVHGGTANNSQSGISRSADQNSEMLPNGRKKRSHETRPSTHEPRKRSTWEERPFTRDSVYLRGAEPQLCRGRSRLGLAQGLAGTGTRGAGASGRRVSSGE